MRACALSRAASWRHFSRSSVYRVGSSGFESKAQRLPMSNSRGIGFSTSTDLGNYVSLDSIGGFGVIYLQFLHFCLCGSRHFLVSVVN